MSGHNAARFNSEGVLLQYHVDAPTLAVKGTVQSDRERIALIKAQTELAALEIILEHLDLSDIAQTRICDALDTIREAIEVKRRDCHGR